jgi:tetratricopeptide (TPR) repeat protein
LLVTSRPSPELAKIQGLEELPLAPLDAADSDDLMRRMTGAGAELIDGLKRSIPLLGAGNPLVITHVVHNLEVDGYLSRGPDGRLTLGTRRLDDYQPPSSVSAVLERTFEQLDTASRSVLGVGALIGRQFQMSDVIGLGLFDDAAVRAAVAAAARHHLCRADGDRITFAHDTVREHLESTVPLARLPELHGRIAERLAARGIGAGPLGHHMERAGRLLPAAQAYFAAALEADRLHDPAGASHACRRAVDTLGRLAASTERDDLLARAAFELSRMAGALGDTGEILRELDRCATLIGEGRARHQVALAGAYARLYYVQGNAPKAAEYSQRCLSISKDDPELATYQCLPINILGRTLAITGKFSRGVEMLTRGCELAREAREYTELSQSLGILGVALGFCGDADEALAAADQCGELAAALEDPLRILGAHLYRSALSEALYDWAEGTRWSTGLLAFAEEHQIGGLYVYVGTVFAGRHQFHLGRIDRARVLLGNALNLSSTLKINMLASWAHAYLGDALLVAGRLDEAHNAYTRGLEMANAGSGDDYGGPLNAMGMAHVMASCAGDDPQRFATGVRKIADDALARLERAGNVSARPVLLQRYAEALEVLGDEAGASEMLGQREHAVRALSVPVLDFWPRLPPRAEATSLREYWRQFAAASSGHQRIFVDPSSDTQSDASRPSHLLEQLSTVVGFKPPF